MNSSFNIFIIKKEKKARNYLELMSKCEYTFSIFFFIRFLISFVSVHEIRCSYYLESYINLMTLELYKNM